MFESIFANPFDMKEYIQRRALEIEDLEERRIYKEVGENLLLKIYQQNQEAFSRLEKRVFDEVSVESQDYSICIGLTDKEHYDATHSFLFPVFPEDVQPCVISAKDVEHALEQKQEYFLYTVYVRASHQELEKFAALNRRYHGVLKTACGEYRASFAVRKDEAYIDKLQSLYQSFVSNDVPWVTVCTAHLQKRFCVFVCTADNLDQGEEIEEIVVDFEEFADLVQYDKIPLWNIETLQEKSSTYPIPCGDKVNYEHRIYAHKLQKDSPYLVAETKSEVVSVQRIEGDLVIIGPRPIPHLWSLYKLNHCPEGQEGAYSLHSNRRKGSFFDRLSGMYWKQVRSRAEIARIVEGFCFEKHLIYQGLEWNPRIDLPQTYDMDDFITTEAAEEAKKEVLCLVFSPVDSQSYFNHDWMSFLVTQVQAAFPDYFCIGRLV